jgi:hypothetical protein
LGPGAPVGLRSDRIRDIMYPAHFFNLFPAFPRENRVFVAMSFEPTFRPRWDEVIAPAVSDVAINGVALEPYRVDAHVVSDSLLTQILDGISRCRVFLADVSAIGALSGRPVRNANVLYEVGLAHATRLPEEVLLFRSDDEALLFDVANVRVNRYDPDGDPRAARQQVASSIGAAFKEIELRRHLAVRRAGETLDYESWMLLFELSQTPGHHPPRRTMRDALGAVGRSAAIVRLLDVGAIQGSFLRVTHDLLKRSDLPPEHLVEYRITGFGAALMEFAARELHLSSIDPTTFS